MNQTHTGWVDFSLSSISTTICNNSSFCITGTNLFVSNDGVLLNSEGGNSTEKKFLDKIINDGQIELDSLTEEGSVEVFEIEDMFHKQGTTKISCKKEIDLNYASILISKTQLLLEMIPDVEFAKNHIIYYGWSSNSTGTFTGPILYV